MVDQDPLNPDELKVLRQMAREFLAKRDRECQERAARLTAELTRQYGPLIR